MGHRLKSQSNWLSLWQPCCSWWQYLQSGRLRGPVKRRNQRIRTQRSSRRRRFQIFVLSQDLKEHHPAMLFTAFQTQCTTLPHPTPSLVAFVVWSGIRCRLNGKQQTAPFTSRNNRNKEATTTRTMLGAGFKANHRKQTQSQRHEETDCTPGQRSPQQVYPHHVQVSVAFTSWAAATYQLSCMAMLLVIWCNQHQMAPDHILHTTGHSKHQLAKTESPQALQAKTRLIHTKKPR